MEGKDLLKKWFYTNNSHAASSDARVPLLDASGNPKGSDTIANLASVLGVTELRKQVRGSGSSKWYRVAKTSNNSTIGGVIGYASFENVMPLIFSFVMMKYDNRYLLEFKSICGDNGLKQNFRYKNTSNGLCLWIRTEGAGTRSFIIPTLAGALSNFDIVQENPPEDALEPTFS